MIVKEEVGGINIDIDLLRIVIIHEECRSLKVFVDSGELTGNTSK